MTLHKTLVEVTDRIIDRSQQSRGNYLRQMSHAKLNKPHRSALSCGNLAHGFAACGKQDKLTLSGMETPNIGIISAYNDMLSAHQPYVDYPDKIKGAIAATGATAQFAGGVPAMCDGVTQGQDGMELSLFSRDLIAQAAAIALSHNMFDGALFLGICDKIVPGLVMAALRFGHLPSIFIPAGPMPSGIPNDEKARIRKLYAQGKATREELLQAESASYHSAGTCTFYGTANTNQMLMEIMGLHIPGSSFVNPTNPLRDSLTEYAATRVTEITALGKHYRPLCDVIDERSIVNGIVGLLATGGSTNHTLHIIAIAKAAGIVVTWDDFSDLSAVVPLLAKVYPNGSADVNHFHAAGGMAFVIQELLGAGLLHGEAKTVYGNHLFDYCDEPFLQNEQLVFRKAKLTSGDPQVLRGVTEPFREEGGLQILKGNLGRSVIKVSAVAPEHQVVEAPARVFHSQHQLAEAVQQGEITQDTVAVVRFQGPKAIGMPELHKLTPFLANLQDQGLQVALVTDGRMSGASGKVPAAIHLTPEACEGGLIARINDGDIIRLDATSGTLELKVSDAELKRRELATMNLSEHTWGMGRELFANMRHTVSGAEQGACLFQFNAEDQA
ncbi:phosphogluconate dehydratase [Pleionea litopenaei]|uniref:Phosphogluconate dehydratase n=1 Tax=Pleionea litopenaei TaxID=3070815 RepID=A0AA51X6U1_9GAMM|nr:phosphogluconate dehydratase [Pleionea sp. HL-JVS1]WMS87191.1 phosphogluconate dehydratase [Pleionea sp. HL-JVS1]